MEVRVRCRFCDDIQDSDRAPMLLEPFHDGGGQHQLLRAIAWTCGAVQSLGAEGTLTSNLLGCGASWCARACYGDEEYTHDQRRDWA